MPPTIPKLKWPLALASGGRLAALEQDSIEEIEQCVALVASVERGSITALPELGITPREMTKNNAAQVAGLVSEVRACEPRADVDASARDGVIPTERFIELTVGRRQAA